MLVLAGDGFNHFDRALSRVMSPLASPLFPDSNFAVADPAQIVQWSSIAADSKVTLDLNLIQNGGAESGLTNWTTAGTVIVDTTFKQSGAQSFKVTGTTGTLIQEVLARAGEWLQMGWAIRGDAAATARIRLYNPKTNHYWNGTAWQAGVFDLDTQTTAAFKVGTPIQILVEDYETVLEDRTPLQFQCVVTNAGSAWFDDLFLNPATNFCSVHAHNIPAGIQPQFRSSTDNFAASDNLKLTLTPKILSFFNYQTGSGAAGQIFDRYIQFKMPGANLPYEKPWVGKIVFGQAVSLPSPPNINYGLGFATPQTRNVTAGGRERVTNRSPKPRRSFNFSSRFPDNASYQASRDWILLRTKQGATPLVLALPEIDTEVCLYAMLSGDEISFAMGAGVNRNADFSVTEMPWPLKTS